MNVEHVLKSDQIKVTGKSLDTYQELLDLRKKTFFGFLEVEKNKGYLEPISYNTSRGQELARLLLFRVLEEAVESYQAQTLLHIQEEAIDSINYLLSVFLLDERFNEVALLRFFEEAVEKRTDWTGLAITQDILSNFTILICGTIAEKFRNRAWMTNPQDIYYSARKEMMENLLFGILPTLLGTFNSFEEFEKLFRAKDAVLQFRLKTKY